MDKRIRVQSRNLHTVPTKATGTAPAVKFGEGEIMVWGISGFRLMEGNRNAAAYFQTVIFFKLCGVGLEKAVPCIGVTVPLCTRGGP